MGLISYVYLTLGSNKGYVKSTIRIPVVMPTMEKRVIPMIRL